MKINAEIHVAFVLSGPLFDADECATYVGIQPTKVSRPKASALQSVPGVAPQSWEVNRQVPNSMALGDAFDELLGIVWPKRARIKSFAKRNNLTISFDAFAYIGKKSIPILTMDAKTLQKIAWFDADMGVDIAVV